MLTDVVFIKQQMPPQCRDVQELTFRLGPEMWAGKYVGQFNWDLNIKQEAAEDTAGVRQLLQSAIWVSRTGNPPWFVFAVDLVCFLSSHVTDLIASFSCISTDPKSTFMVRKSSKGLRGSLLPVLASSSLNPVIIQARH